MLGLRFCARAFSSCGERGPLFIAVRGPLTIAASRCGAQAPDTQAQQLWLTGPAAPWHVGSSQTRPRTRVPCISRQILNHCAPREAHSSPLLKPLALLPFPQAVTALTFPLAALCWFLCDRLTYCFPGPSCTCPVCPTRGLDAEDQDYLCHCRPVKLCSTSYTFCAIQYVRPPRI